MTLRNNPLNMGVVVWSVEPGKAAEAVRPLTGHLPTHHHHL